MVIEFTTCSTVIVTAVEMKNQMATYMCFSRRLTIVPNKFTANATHTTAMATLIGHSSSAYSLLVVNPSGRVIAAATMMSCHPQKLNQLKKSLNIRALHSRWSE